MPERLTKHFEETELSNLKSFPSPYVSEGNSVFYSGEGNDKRAKEYANDNNMTPIQETRSGKILEKLDGVVTAQAKPQMGRSSSFITRFGKNQGPTIWNEASRTYAAATRGTVKTFVAGAGANSTFRKIEMPALLNNKKVFEINGINRTKIDQMRRQQFARLRLQGVEKRQAAECANRMAYKKIAIGEIRQDMARARVKKHEALEQDARSRLATLRDQNKGQIAAKNQMMHERRRGLQPGAFIEGKGQRRFAADRYKQIEQRSYARGLAKGLTHELAKSAAQDRVHHVRQKIDLNAERKALRGQGTKLSENSSQAYQARLEIFRETRISDLQRQAAREDRVYKGPPMQDAGLRKTEINLRSNEFVQRTRLEGAVKAGDYTESERIRAVKRMESQLSATRETAISEYKSKSQDQHQSPSQQQMPLHTQDQQQVEVLKADHPLGQTPAQLRQDHVSGLGISRH